MFTGLVEDVGRVEAAQDLSGGRGRRLEVSARLFGGEQTLGASIAIDGVCLTVVAWHGGRAAFDVGPETLERTTLGALAVGAPVNLERPLALGDRLGGHMVAGHVDGVATISARAPRGEAVDVTIALAPPLLRYVVEKGSVAVDGISLTVNRVGPAGFDVSLIPHTQSTTTLAHKQSGARVNIEVDLIGKYVEKLLGGYPHVHV